MPFKSDKQRRYLWANEPEIARRWTKEHGSRIQKDDGGRIGYGIGSFVKEKTNPKIEDFLRNDPFYWSGGYKLENVKPFSDDPDKKRAQRNIEKESLGYNPYSDPNIYVRNINDPDPWVGSDVTHEGVHEVISPTFASQSEKDNIIQDVITDYSATLPPGKRSSINPKVMNEIVTNYISNMIHGDVESLQDTTTIDKDLMKALKKNIDPAIGQGYFKKYASRAHQNINAMNQERLNQMLGVASLDVDEDENVPLRFRDAKTLADYYNPRQRALRQSNRYWNRGDARTGPEKWMGNIGGNIRNYGQKWMGGLRNIGQGIGRFMGDRFQKRPAVGFTPAYYGTGAPRLNKQGQQLGYSAARLNQMNALGGYYSEPARAARRVDQRRINILNRAAAGKPVGNVAQLLGPNYSSDGGGGIQFTGTPAGDPTAGAGYSRKDDSWSASPFARGGLASIWPR